MKNFVTIFPVYQDFHYFKDPGQIPFRFKKLGYKSKIVCYDNKDDYRITRENIELEFLECENRSNKIIAKYLYKNSKKIDILNLFHIDWNTLLAAFIFKILNPSGVVYVKMDNCCYTATYDWEKNLQTPFYDNNYLKYFKRILMRSLFIKKIDFFSIEDMDSKELYSKFPQLNEKLFCSYNGYTNDLFNYSKLTSFAEKENIILTVGNIGNYSKATNVLLDAFALIGSTNDWTLHLAGNVNNDFIPFKEEYFKKHPELKGRVVFHGWLDKEPLFDLYNKSKIFALPSYWEGFANVFSEAMYFRNAIITSKFVSPRELIRNKCGTILESINENDLAKAISDLVKNPEKLQEYAEYANEFALKNLNWNEIALDISEKLGDSQKKQLSHSVA